MLQIVESIYKMTGQMVKLPDDEDTPEKVRYRLFENAKSYTYSVAEGRQDLP